jgi:hypothetical protein
MLQLYYSVFLSVLSGSLCIYNAHRAIPMQVLATSVRVYQNSSFSSGFIYLLVIRILHLLNPCLASRGLPLPE